MKNQKGHARSGFSSTDLLLIVAAITGIVLVVLPAMFRSRGCRAPATRIQCTGNLKQVGLAFRVWAADHNDRMPMTVAVTNGGAMEVILANDLTSVFQVMSNELNTPKILFCPADPTSPRTRATLFAGTIPTNPREQAVVFSATNNLSYFVGLDATDTQPEMFLTGDDHIAVAGVKPKPGLFLLPTNAPVEWRDERHPKQGNVGLADGSVQGFSTTAFRRALVQIGIATNRLAMP